MSEMRRVTAIRNGTVVDHIPSGRAMQVIRLLRIDTDRSTPVSLVMNVPSDKIGRKDVLKIEDRELSHKELDRLALIAPSASIAIISLLINSDCPETIYDIFFFRSETKFDLSKIFSLISVKLKLFIMF